MVEAGITPDPWQANVLNSNASRLMLLCSRQAGKSLTAAALAVLTAVVEAPALILLLSPTQRQSGELFRDKVRRIYNGLGKPVATTQESQLQMELANGSRIVSLPGDEETIRGYSGVKLIVIDEASRVPDSLYYAVRPMLAVSGGRLVAMSTPFGKRGWFYTEWHNDSPWERVRITAEQCPRIPREFLEEERRTLGEDWYAQEYGCEFRDGGGSPLFPSEWLDRANELASQLNGKPRQAEGVGVDPGEGSANTSMCAVDRFGVIELVSKRTPDTSIIPGDIKAFMRKHGALPSQVCIDRGGGGFQHANVLRAEGLQVRTVAFGEAVVPEPRRHTPKLSARLEEREERYVYCNRRAQLYGEFSTLLDPVSGNGFAIPRGGVYAELKRQLGAVPKMFDGEVRLRLPPKNRKDPESEEVTMTQLLGCSPDESDACALACHAMLHRPAKIKLGAS